MQQLTHATAHRFNKLPDSGFMHANPTHHHRLQLAAVLRSEGQVPDDLQTLALRALAVQVGTRSVECQLSACSQPPANARQSTHLTVACLICVWTGSY